MSVSTCVYMCGCNDVLMEVREHHAEFGTLLLTGGSEDQAQLAVFDNWCLYPLSPLPNASTFSDINNNF